MERNFRRIGADRPVLARHASAIGPLTSQFSFATEAIEMDVICCRPYVNDRLNSRTAKNLPNGEWKVRCSSELEANSRPKHVLHSSGRVIIQGAGPWLLFDEECRQLARGYASSSDIFLDSSNGNFYFSDSVGMLAVRKLENGTQAYSVSLTFGRNYRRSMIAWLTDRIVIASTEREIDQDCEEKPSKSTIEVFEFTDPFKIDEDGELESGRVVASLLKDTLVFQTAVHNDVLVAVTNGEIAIVDRNLDIHASFHDDFEPVSLSLDGAGIIYIVINDHEILKLRAITQKGEKLFSAELPQELDYRLYPPIIGYDHRIYLLGFDRLMAFARGGLCLWEYSPGHPIGGAIITPGNELIISSGSEVGVFDAAGHYRRLYEFKGETVQTPPALNKKGELLVATDKRLYCLTTVTSRA